MKQKSDKDKLIALLLIIAGFYTVITVLILLSQFQGLFTVVLILALFYLVAWFLSRKKKEIASREDPDNALASFYGKCAVEKEAEITRREAETKVTRQIELLRLSLVPDIKATLAGSGCAWDWANSATTECIMVGWPKEKIMYPALLRLDSTGRVTDITGYKNGKYFCIENRPYLNSCRVALFDMEGLVRRFFETRGDGQDVHVQPFNRMEALCFLNSTSLGLDNALCRLVYQAGECISIQVLGDGDAVVSVLERGDKKPVTPTPKKEEPQPQAKPASEPDAAGTAAPVPKPAKEETAEKPKEEAAVEPDAGTESAPVDGPVPHAEPVDVDAEPGIPDWLMNSQAQLEMDVLFSTLETSASDAIQKGLDYIEIDWPEGLLTTKEIDVFCKLLLETSSFTGTEVDKEHKKIKIFLPKEIDDSEAAQNLETPEEVARTENAAEDAGREEDTDESESHEDEPPEPFSTESEFDFDEDDLGEEDEDAASAPDERLLDILFPAYEIPNDGFPDSPEIPIDESLFDGLDDPLDF